MIITPVAHGLEELLVAPAPGYVRGAGLHMSTLYNDLYKVLEPKRYDRRDKHGNVEPMDPLRVGLGLALEEFLEHALKERLCGGGRPGEFTCDDFSTPILFSPDMIIFNHVTRLGEMKLTWMSSSQVPRERSNAFPPKFAKYVTQMACYCRCLETPYARLIAFFVNGRDNWKQRLTGTGFGPELLAWDIEFTKREMDDEWAAVINHARHQKLL